MSLLTLVSAPKPFTDPRIGLIQSNAIASWTQLNDVEILLMGAEIGVADAAQSLGVRIIRNVATNASGTPLISSMVQLARENSQSPLLCLVNADMILMDDFVEAARRTKTLKDAFVLLGRRWDLDIPTRIDFVDDWKNRLRAEVAANGILHRPAGSDFFVFPRACYTGLPDFAVGRAGWDNWMIYWARKQDWPVIDATPSIMAIHQHHDYSHLPGGAPHYAVPESDENIRLAGGAAPIRYTVLDATHCLQGGKLTRPSMSYLRFMRGIELFLRSVFFFLPANMVEEVARPKRWKKRFLKIIGRT